MTFLLRRALFYLVTLWAAITVNFLLPRLLPGDPVQAMIIKLGGRLNSDAMASLYVLFGLDEQKSIWEQYLDYWGALFQGDLGLSFTFFPTPVADVLSQSLPWTLGLVGVTTVIAFLLGTLMGVYAGWKRGSWMDNLIPLTTFLSSIPYFWLGLIAISLLSVTWPLFPASGGYAAGLVPEFSGEFIGSVLEHAVLPGVTIVVSSVAGWILGMRNMMVTVTAEDYVLVARAKGLTRKRIMFAYAARNAVLPSISGFALSLGFIVGGALLVEMVFSYPGLGYVLFQGIGAKDYPLMQGVFLVITLTVLVANLLADIGYLLLDPRTRREG
ncbi:ABC transporter permease [Lentzea jiangxiensis]|uniref:Peptide/nickel transport system permease protein n=1 Tax=Lentzea jiangxiensis TaxID=641025 RepID=A0A1H0WR14_9PSEU|nr:ABC transporter permease [Lentzea jiangxiensis]SDP93108.1 peptide/nickel transport system permease protein [Lentzea jiangxiensis]